MVKWQKFNSSRFCPNPAWVFSFLQIHSSCEKSLRNVKREYSIGNTFTFFPTIFICSNILDHCFKLYIKCGSCVPQQMAISNSIIFILHNNYFPFFVHIFVPDILLFVCFMDFLKKNAHKSILPINYKDWIYLKLKNCHYYHWSFCHFRSVDLYY